MISSSFTRKTWWETREERECLLFSLKNSSLSSRVRCFRESLLFVLLREKTRRIKRGDVSSSAFVVLCFKVCFFLGKNKKKRRETFFWPAVFLISDPALSQRHERNERQRETSRKKSERIKAYHRLPDDARGKKFVCSSSVDVFAVTEALCILTSFKCFWIIFFSFFKSSTKKSFSFLSLLLF